MVEGPDPRRYRDGNKCLMKDANPRPRHRTKSSEISWGHFRSHRNGAAMPSRIARERQQFQRTLSGVLGTARRHLSARCLVSERIGATTKPVLAVSGIT